MIFQTLNLDCTRQSRTPLRVERIEKLMMQTRKVVEGFRVAKERSWSRCFLKEADVKPFLFSAQRYFDPEDQLLTYLFV